MTDEPTAADLVRAMPGHDAARMDIAFRDAASVIMATSPDDMAAACTASEFIWLYAEQLQTYLEELLRLLPVPAWRRGHLINVGENRAGNLWALSKHMRDDHGAPHGEILAALRKANAETSRPPLPDADLEYITAYVLSDDGTPGHRTGMEGPAARRANDDGTSATP